MASIGPGGGPTSGGAAGSMAAGSTPDLDPALGVDAGVRDLGRPARPNDLGVADPNDLGVAGATADLAGGGGDLAPRSDLAKVIVPADGGSYTPPGNDDSPLAHAPPSTMTGATTLLAGQDVLDVSTDQGGGVWAVTASRVYYLSGGHTYTYDQSSGLARGESTWTDSYYGFGTSPVTFSSVSGATSGQAVIGNIGAIADRLEVNPSTGAVTRVDNMKVTQGSLTADEYAEQLQRVVAVWRVVADLNGTLDGSAYLGGFHGMYSFHGLNGDCGCLSFEQHLHAFADWAPDGIAGGDVRAMAFTADGDVWQGDRDLVALWPQRSLGANADFFQDQTVAIDVFPNVRDEVWGLGVDSGGGLYVASYGNGLAWLAPATHAPSYWSRATTLPQDHLTDVTVDGAGDVWIATQSGGVARLTLPGTWTYYTSASGLAGNSVRRIYVDRFSGTRVVYLATSNGVTVFAP